MRAVGAVARAELRARWRSLVAVGLLLGLVGGAVLAAVAVAHRTATAYPRLVEATGLDDARVFVPADQPGLLAVVPALPGVETAWTTSSWVARVQGPVLRYVSVGAGEDRPPGLVEPVVLEGRAPAPDAPDELLLGEPFAEASGLRVGDELTLELLTLEEISQFAVGFGDPDGATVTMRVVGVGRMTYWSGALSNTLAGPAFARAHGTAAAAHPVFLRLRDGAGPEFAAAFEEAAARAPTSVVDMYLPPRVELPTTDTDPAVLTAERVLTTGLAVVAVVLAGGALVVVGQALARQHAAGRAAQQVESALGLTAGERLAARLLAALPGAALAAGLGGGLGLAAGWLPALGAQARFEPAPGWLAPTGIAVGGGLALGAVLLLLTVPAVVLGGRPLRPRPVVHPAGRIAPGLRRPAVLVGAGLVLRGRRGGRGPLALLGGVLVVAAVVAAATVGAGLQRLVDTPERYGQVADLAIVDAREETVAALAADPRVAAVDILTSGDVVLRTGERTAFVALEHRLGALPVATASGRPPERAGEVAVGPRIAARLGLAVGDVLDVRRPAGGTAPLTVTGVVVVNTQQTGELGALGETGLVVPEQLPALTTAEPLVGASVAARPGQVDALFDDLSREVEVFRAETPDEIRNLADLLLLPELLALVLALVGAAGIVHAVVTGARRHAGSLAVLAAVGGTPGQVRAAIAVMATVAVVPALVLGVPLGLAVARVLWWEIATGTGVAGDVALPGPVLLAIGPAVALAALAAAVRPALRAVRTGPAAVLREE